MIKPTNKFLSFFIIGFVYTLAAIIGLLVFDHLNLFPWLSLLIADLAATLFVWVASMILHNASVYDPYWSVQPVVILAITLARTPRAGLGSWALFLIVLFWGARLTYNWMVTFTGMHAQDWRYDKLQNRSGKFFPLVNLFGIQVMPTLIVYACTLPAFYYIINRGAINTWTIIGFIISLTGAVLELVADEQMHAFKRQRPSRTCLIRKGVWRHARHPNYLGEIMMWWGVYLVLLSVHPELWLLGTGALINTLLFLFISIPLNEQHLADYKEGYSVYKQQTRMLLPFPKIRHLSNPRQDEVKKG